jgi:hypothetical protein
MTLAPASVPNSTTHWEVCVAHGQAVSGGQRGCHHALHQPPASRQQARLASSSNSARQAQGVEQDIGTAGMRRWLVGCGPCPSGPMHVLPGAKARAVEDCWPQRAASIPAALLRGQGAAAGPRGAAGTVRGQGLGCTQPRLVVVFSRAPGSVCDSACHIVSTCGALSCPVPRFSQGATHTQLRAGKGWAGAPVVTMVPWGEGGGVRAAYPHGQCLPAAVVTSTGWAAALPGCYKLAREQLTAGRGQYHHCGQVVRSMSPHGFSCGRVDTTCMGTWNWHAVPWAGGSRTAGRWPRPACHTSHTSWLPALLPGGLRLGGSSNRQANWLEVVFASWAAVAAAADIHCLLPIQDRSWATVGSARAVPAGRQPLEGGCGPKCRCLQPALAFDLTTV